MRGPNDLQRGAAGGAEDRQRALDEVCRRALRDFVGRKVTPTLMVEAELTLRAQLDEAVRAGVYVLPDGLVIDRVELGTDRRIKVLFKKTDDSAIYERGLLAFDRLLALAALVPGPAYDARQAAYAGGCEVDPVETKLKSRFEAVAAELDDEDEPT